MVVKFEGRQAWLALLCSSLSYTLMAIPDGSYAILYDYLIDIYNANRTSIGWALSLYWISIYMAGLIFSPVIDLYGCRTLAIISAIMFSSGLALASISYSLGSLYITYGVLSGLGCGGLFLGCSSIVQQRFTYNRGFATGIASLGFSVGAVINPLHTLFFLRTFAVRGTLLIHAGLALHTLVFSLALKSPKSFREQTNTSSAVEKSPSQLDDVQDECRPIRLETVPTKSDNTNNYLDASEEVPMENTEIKTCEEQPHDLGSEIIIQEPFPNEIADKKPNKTDLASRLRRFFVDNETAKIYFRKMFDFTLLRKGTFVLAVLHFFLLWMARLSIMAQLVSCAIRRGIGEDAAAYLISISGFGNLLMRIIAAVLMNFSWMNPVLFSGVASVAVMTSGILAAFSETYLMFSMTAALMGISEAIAFSILPLLVVHIVGVHRFPRGIALLNTMMLPAPLGAAPFSGWLVDISGNYFAAFLVIGCEGAISTSLAIILFFLIRRNGHTTAKM